MPTIARNMMHSWIHLPLCLLMALTKQYTEARPTTAEETRLSREDAESPGYRIFKSSELLEDPIKIESNASSNDSSKRDTISGTEKGAIVGGTVAAGIILGVTVFVSVLIYRQYCLRHQRLRGQVENTTSSSKSSRPGTGFGSSTYRSWRHTFNHRVSIPDSESVYSQRSFGNFSPTDEVEMLPTRSFPPPTIPQKAAQMLGVEGVSTSGPITPLIRTPIPSPRLPNSTLGKHFMAGDPLTQNPSRQHILPQGPPTQDPTPTTPDLAAGDGNKISTDSRTRTSSNCTMSTLGRELLHDVMQPLPPIKFNPPPDKTTLPRPPPPISKTTRPPPVSMNNSKGQKRAPSRRYFVPLFKKNGQLPSPTSPDVALATEAGITEEEGSNTKLKTETETVLRDSLRAGLFSLGENKI
ncbi:hypothetical protein NW752_002196 [Fusarium irregulare]|uniref:Uncharacterized protein n=1 Tax=Fusarium irregulare TaxID=2494466 RepID=A0A9W8PH66_9HYPO|nr:hypothetical protein NW766_011230 [Fusarium irregulare]KAJ4027233.1 hypothetical protein NW752_002196 [Fusarium irregulare]